MKRFVKDLMEKTWYLIENLIPSSIFLFSCYMKHKIKEILGFYEHFSVSFFTEDIRTHWKDPVKPGAAPVLPLYLQVGMWPGSAGCILSASLLPIDLFWYSLTTAAPREKKHGQL